MQSLGRMSCLMRESLSRLTLSECLHPSAASQRIPPDMFRPRKYADRYLPRVIIKQARKTAEVWRHSERVSRERLSLIKHDIRPRLCILLMIVKQYLEEKISILLLKHNSSWLFIFFTSKTW